MSRWYRAYAGTVKDDKLAEVAVVAGCSRSVAIASWHAILESAAESNSGGAYDTTPRRVAAALGEPTPVIEAVFAAMAEIGMVGDGAVTAWQARQFESDSSTERSRKHRERSRNGDATLQQRSATPPDTDTDTERLPDTQATPSYPRAVGKPTRTAQPDHFEDFWKAYPSRGTAANPKATAAEAFRRAVKSGVDPGALVAAAKAYRAIEQAAGRDGTDKIAQAVTWLSQKRWGDYEARGSPENSTTGVYIQPGTPEFEAWTTHRGGKPPIYGIRGAWVESRFPKGHQESAA